MVARFGEMDISRWWNTGDPARRTALLGRTGAVLVSRGFPRTHRFAQARIVFEVARVRCAEVFEAPGCATLWSLPAPIEDQFDCRWAAWLESCDSWKPFFAAIESPQCGLIDTLRELELISHNDIEIVSRLRRSAEGRALPIPGVHPVTDGVISLLAAGFSRGEHSKLAVPHVRLED